MNLLTVALIFSLFISTEVSSSSPARFIECAGCEVAVKAFKYIYAKNTTRYAVINVASYICEHFVKVESLVCRGLAAQYREELLYILSQLIFNPPAFCGMLIQGCGYYNPLGNWNVSLPPIPKNRTYPIYPVKRKQNLRVLQLTDIHIDVNYTSGSVANCKSYICCQPDSQPKNENQKVLAGYWGTLAACDMPLRTVERLLQHINKTEKLDYIFISGDYVAHSDWEYTKDSHLNIIRTLSELLELYFPDIPKYWTLGNHDSVPLNSFAPHYVPAKFQPKWMYKQLWAMQRHWVDDNQQSVVEYRGSFRTQIMNGLRLLSLNTGYCETTNFWIYVNETDPDGTMTWLVSELAAAELEGQYVQILAHIPPGNEECLEGWARNYYRVVNRFSKTIVGQFFGHIHVDSFTIFYADMNDDASEPTNFLFTSPSVTTYAGLNPAYRIYEFKAGSQFEIVDYSTYFLNLSLANGKKELEWQLLYSARKDYGLQNITAKGMNELIDRLTVDENLLARFVRNSVRRSDYKCDKKCHYKTVCTLKKAHHNDELCSHVAGYVDINNKRLFLQQSQLLKNELLDMYYRKTSDAKVMLSKGFRKYVTDARVPLK